MSPVHAKISPNITTCAKISAIPAVQRIIAENRGPQVSMTITPKSVALHDKNKGSRVSMSVKEQTRIDIAGIFYGQEFGISLKCVGTNPLLLATVSAKLGST